MLLFPFSEYWWFYLAFIVFVLGLLALDLGVFHKKAHEVSVKEASIWTAVWIGLAFLFNVGLYFYSSYKFGDNPEISKQVSMEFLTGFIIEKTLAIDNIFVFALVFSFFAIPKVAQHRILFYGILGALFFRALFIALGSYLMAYHWLVVLFGAVLILTGIKILYAAEKTPDIGDSIIIKTINRFFRVTESNDKFIVRKQGLLYVTPLFVALMFIELSDIIFALDSVPAIFAITKEPLIVFTSNIFAILGLRSMYFMLAGVMDKFHLIKYGMGSVLIFVGLKMVWLNNAFDGKFPISWSLAIIAALIGGSMIASVLFPKKKENAIDKIFQPKEVV